MAKIKGMLALTVDKDARVLLDFSRFLIFKSSANEKLFTILINIKGLYQIT